MATKDDTVWGADTPVSLPVPAKRPVLVNMGALGFSEYGMIHDLNSVNVEDFIPTYLPQIEGQDV